ncbi:MAG: hypothetical protein JST00_11720 [Deltaproteobacteria bacterium]|nr:hypothetical protein [Deltaproteobacteria bacterium]
MTNATSYARKATVTLLLTALSLVGVAGCAGDLEPTEPPTPASEARDDEANASEAEGANTGSVSQALAIGGGGTGGGKSCGVPPRHCGGNASMRGAYPGCSVTCKAGETPMCIPGDCFWRRGGVCTCQGPVYYPQ